MVLPSGFIAADFVLFGWECHWPLVWGAEASGEEMSKLEEGARAMHAHAIKNGAPCPPWDELEMEVREEAIGLARAAVEALRDPSAAMYESNDLHSNIAMRLLWQDMIDAILNEPTT